MKSSVLLIIAFLLTAFFAEAQVQQISVNANIKLPKDSTESVLLITSLNKFLDAAQAPNEENKFVLESQKIETFILLDEIYDIQKSKEFEDEHFYKPSLINIVSIEEGGYLLQLSYIGINENKPLLKAIFELIAHKANDQFLFSSPLLKNTRNWKTTKVGNTIVHYKDSVNQKNILDYEKDAALFDAKLKSIDKTTEFYCCKDLLELLKLIGVEYRSDYNGIPEGSFSSKAGDEKLVMLGNSNEHFKSFDPHDLWHARLSLIVSRRDVNHSVDEACAYLYGGSWGISWEAILAQFMTKVASDKNTDWADFKENPVNFGKSQRERLMVDYVVNALIVQELEKEEGFSAVWELLNNGNDEKGNDNYYRILEKLAGITKANYNEKVWDLVKKAR